MQRLTRDNLFKNYGDHTELPTEPAMEVELGEEFEIETVDTADVWMMSEADVDKPWGPMAGNPCTGPVSVREVKAGDVVAVRIEELKVLGHCTIDVDPGDDDPPLLPPEAVRARRDFVRIEDGYAHFPAGILVSVRPMYGCFGVVPAEPSPEPWHHGGNMDIPDICAGNTVHVRAQRDGAWFCCGDGHALQGDGEISGVSLEVSLEGRLRIDRSPFDHLKTMMVETPSEYIMIGTEGRPRDSVVSAVHAMSDLLARHRSIELLEAYQLVTHVSDLRLGAVWPMWTNKWKGIPIPMRIHLSKEHFE